MFGKVRKNSDVLELIVHIISNDWVVVCISNLQKDLFIPASKENIYHSKIEHTFILLFKRPNKIASYILHKLKINQLVY